MGRKSTIQRMPPELRREIDRLLVDDKLTHAQIVEHMRQLGSDVSESAVWRYNARMRDLSKDIRLTREMAAAVGRELAASPDGRDPSRMVIESIQSLLLKARMQLASSETIDDKVLERLANTARSLAAAMKASVDVETKVEDRILRKAATAAEKSCRAQGFSEKTINTIREAVLGIRLPEGAKTWVTEPSQ